MHVSYLEPFYDFGWNLSNFEIHAYILVLITVGGAQFSSFISYQTAVRGQAEKNKSNLRQPAGR